MTGIRIFGPLIWVGVLVLTSLVRVASAQSTVRPIAAVRAPEVYAQTGIFQAGSDEGGIGSPVASYGVTFTIPIFLKLALDVDAQTGRVSTTMGHPRDIYRTRRTLVTPSLVRRFGHERLYWYVGVGLGDEYIDESYHLEYHHPGTRGWREVAPGIYEKEQQRTHGTIAFKAGISGFITRQLGVRCDVYTASYHKGLRCGAGYRFD